MARRTESPYDSEIAIHIREKSHGALLGTQAVALFVSDRIRGVLETGLNVFLHYTWISIQEVVYCRAFGQFSQE